MRTIKMKNIVLKHGVYATRFLGPYYHDELEPEKSLYWFAYNTNKRGITLDLDSVLLISAITSIVYCDLSYADNSRIFMNTLLVT